MPTVKEIDILFIIMVKSHSLLPALFLALLVACTTAPYTGRSQLMFLSEGQEVGLGEEAYRHTLRDSVLTNHPEALRIVRKIGERIARAANKPDYKWEFRVIDDPEIVSKDLLKFIKGPDFPTGGLAYGYKDMLHAYSSGRGGVVCRGEAEITEDKNGRKPFGRVSRREGEIKGCLVEIIPRDTVKR